MEVRSFYDETSRTMSIRRHGSTPDRDNLGLPVNVVQWVNFYWQKVQLKNMEAELDRIQGEIKSLESETEYPPFPGCYFPSIPDSDD